ncbi:MAG: hypothetical protein H0W61_15390 [Bacteroidetes bacterium]|nr:hypothetical protein [Bacteroidota bacterium]
MEEQISDASGKKIKSHYYTYDQKGLKMERKTIDASGKLISIRKYTYEFK